VRGYIPVKPLALAEFIADGTYRFSTAYVTTKVFFHENSEIDEEEREFELSWLAAQDSRRQQGFEESYGFVLAVDLTTSQVGVEIGYQIELLSDISWSQVNSLMVAESSELELTWYASQEIAENIHQWTA
jgi:hypothetical protein